MKSNKLPFVLLLLVLLAGCGSSGGGSSTPPPPALASLAVTPASSSIPLGLTVQFTARGTYSNANPQNLTASVTWSSSNTAVATIDNAAGMNGLATSKSPGTTTITATSGSVSAFTTLTVTAAQLVSIAITPANVSIPTGTTQQYAATGTYSDNSVQDATSSATWSSSSTAVATISNATSSIGIVTSIAAGTTIITAALGNVTSSTALLVTGGPTTAADNVLPITVNGSLCSANTSAGYLNKPCVSVTVCTPGSTTECQTIDDILLDTGSYGLRIFANAAPSGLTVTLPAVPGGSGTLANCAQFADLSADWGPVKLADVVLGNERAANVPIQVIDATFGTPTSCGTPDANPAAAGFNGILGVGVLPQDCGSACVPAPNNPNQANNGIYYSCNGTTCTGTTAPLANQVSNPVALLPQDNNGVIVQLPSVPTSGSPSVNGILVLGIGTQTNNTATGVTRYNTDRFGQIITVLNGTAYSSIIDSGSNGLFFTPPSSGQLPTCSSSSQFSWFCPANTVSLSATNKGISGSPSIDAFFQIGNFNSLTADPSLHVFSNIGGSATHLFDWGLPFYLGRNIYVGIEGTTSSLGTGPYFAY